MLPKNKQLIFKSINASFLLPTLNDKSTEPSKEEIWNSEGDEATSNASCLRPMDTFPCATTVAASVTHIFSILTVPIKNVM